MKNRIRRLIEKEEVTSQQFANEIGIAPSSLHHIVSGRNNPSLEVIQKILSRFSYLNAEWLINGKGNPFKNMVQGELFDLPAAVSINDEPLNKETEEKEKDVKLNSIIKSSKKEIDKIVVFYLDDTFKVYNKEE